MPDDDDTLTVDKILNAHRKAQKIVEDTTPAQGLVTRVFVSTDLPLEMYEFWQIKKRWWIFGPVGHWLVRRGVSPWSRRRVDVPNPFTSYAVDGALFVTPVLYDAMRQSKLIADPGGGGPPERKDET